MAFKVDDLKKVMESRRDGETISQVVRRLQRAGDIDDPTNKKKRLAFVVKANVKKFLHERDLIVSEDVFDELDASVQIILEAAIKAARMNTRKTVKGVDIRGDSVAI